MKQSTENRAGNITDVTSFFNDISEGYLRLEHNSLHLMNRIPSLTPEQIKEECDLLVVQKTTLNQQDDQLLDIIKLTDDDVSTKTLIYEYQVALAKAIMACDNLFQRLSALKSTMQDQES